MRASHESSHYVYALITTQSLSFTVFFMKTDDVKGQRIFNMCAFDVYDRKRNAQRKYADSCFANRRRNYFLWLLDASRKKSFSEKCAEQEEFFSCI